MKSSVLKLVLVASLMSLPLLASAQLYLGGSIAGATAKVANSSADSKSWSFRIQPEIGYLLNDDWAIGGRFSYRFAEGRLEYAAGSQVTSNTNELTINPYAAYSPFRRGNFALWAEVGLEFAPALRAEDYSSYGAYAIPVLTYELGDHLVLKSSLGFASLAVSGTSNGDFSFSGSVGGKTDLTVGFVYKF